MNHTLALITVDKRGAGAKWSCSCGACGFCWPEGPYDHDVDSRSVSLYVDAQAGHRRHAANAIVVAPASPADCAAMRRRVSWYCRRFGWPAL